MTWLALKAVPIKFWLILAAIVAALAFTGAVYGKGYLAAKHAVEVSNLREEAKQLRLTIAKRDKANAELSEAAAEDAEKIVALNQEIEDSVQALKGDRQRECLSESDTDELIKLWKNKEEKR